MNFFITLVFMAMAMLCGATPTPQNTGNDQNSQKEPRKRGVAYNNPNFVKFFDDPNSRVAWMYNWDSQPNGDTHMWYEYVPMLWSPSPGNSNQWADNVDKRAKLGNGRMHVLSFNEPDLCCCGASCISVGDAINGHKKFVEPLRKYGDRLKIVSPAVTNGINGKGLDYLEQFLKGCNGCKIDFVAIHWYSSAKDFDNFKKHVEDAHRRSSSRDVWITELGPQGSEEEIKDFLRKALPWLDQQSYVFRYCMHFAGQGYLVNQAGTGLSSIGQLYNTYG